jgi:uncharacterized protein YjiS (DUF1127 family)
MAFLLSSERPAVADSSPISFAAFAHWLRMANAKRARRTTLQSLLDMEEFRLDDLGINRQDLIEAITAPQHGAALLHERRAESARRWFGSAPKADQVRS